MNLKEKILEIKERAIICGTYIKHAFKRWTAPRTYVVAFTYRNKQGIYVVDSMVMRAVVPRVATLIGVIQKDLALEGTDLRVLSFTEAPACLFNGMVLDAADKLVANADKVADDLKQKGDFTVQAEPEPEEQEEEDEDVSDMFK